MSPRNTLPDFTNRGPRRAMCRPLCGLSLVAAGMAAAWSPPARAQAGIQVAQATTGATAQQVVVTATRHVLPLADAPASMSVVTGDEALARGADNTTDALAGQQGISLIGRPLGGRRQLSVRGMESRHTLMLVDGQRLAATDGVIGHSDFQGDWVSMLEVQRIELVRGPMSMLYGAEALGGVVNLVTRTPGKRLAGVLRGEGIVAQGSRGGDGHRFGARVEVPLSECLQAAITVDDVRRAALRNPDDPGADELEGRQRRMGALQTVWQAAPGHRFTLDARQGEETRFGSARLRGSGAPRYYASTTELDRRHLALTWDGEDTRGSATAPLAGWQAQLRIVSSSLDMSNRRVGPSAALKPVSVDEQDLDGHAVLPVAVGLAQPLKVTAGFEHRNEGLWHEALAGGHGVIRHDSLYTQGEATLGPVEVTLGARHDRASRWGSANSVRAYAVWHAAPGLVVKGGVGQGYKPPTLKQIVPGFAETEGPYLYQGNPDLKPERNRASEIGVAWTQPLWGVSLTAFHNRVRDLVVPVATGITVPAPTYRFQNLDTAVLKGIEAGAAFGAAAGPYGRIDLQWLDARDEQGNRIDRRPRTLANVEAGWREARWRAAALVQHQTGLLLTPSTPANAAPVPVPAFTMAQVNASWQATSAVELGLAVDNAGNVRMAELSPLYVNAVPPRTLRAWLQARF